MESNDNKLLYRHESVITVLKANPNLILSTLEIKEQSGLAYGTVARALKELMSMKLVKQVPGRGHSYKYYLIKKRTAEGVLPVEAKVIPELTGLQIKRSLEVISKPHWDTKTNDVSWKVINQAAFSILNMFGATTRGDEIIKEDLEHNYKELKHAYEIIQNANTKILQMLNSEDLWDINKIGVFLSE